MLPAVDLTVWLETSVQQGATTLIPYVRSVKDMDLHYSISLTTLSSAGTSNIVQGGNVRIIAGETHKLSSLTTKRDPSSRCSLGVSLSKDNIELMAKQYDCSAP